MHFIFRKIIKETEIEPQNIFYIEDKISHLIKVKTLGINGYLATWGYNSPSARDEAILNDITPIANLKNLEKIKNYILGLLKK